MLKIENVEVVGIEAAIRGMRNPKNSWPKSDSVCCANSSVFDHCSDCPYFKADMCNADTGEMETNYILGPNDQKLAMSLAKGGPVHAKYRRMIVVYLDITAPLYWWPEMDTYKVGTVRNSCSFMHKGVSKPFEITDFSLKDERIYTILSPLTKKTYELSYPYQTDEFRLFTDLNNKTYRVYRNGYVIREAFEYTDNWGKGRTRKFDDDEPCIYQDDNGYFVVKLSGRDGGRILLHRLVAKVWCDKPEGANQVNHIDGDKGNNSAENLEWVTAQENMQKACELGLYAELHNLHRRYKLWKAFSTVIPVGKRMEFSMDIRSGLTHKELADKWDITPSQANNIRYSISKSENEYLFQECYIWDQLLEQLNYMRSLFIETKDEQVFQSIRALIPQGYMQRSTVMLNYEVLHNIYFSRKDHRLDEWHTFCDWIKTLPYSELITMEENA